MHANRLASCFLEGPAAPNGDVYFSDIAGHRILKMDAKGQVSVFRADSGRTNGNCFDAQGRLISCNGACVDNQGQSWFTDPRYGTDRSDLEMDVEGVYRIDPNGQVTRVLTQKDIHRPNGIAAGKTLYVVDSHPKPGGNRKIWAFDMGADGSLSSQRLVYDFGKGRGGDGMKVDTQGNLWVATGLNSHRGNPGETLDVPAGVYVITPQGKLLGRIPINADLITNVPFGSSDRKTLFVTAGKTLYRIPVPVAGQEGVAPRRHRRCRWTLLGAVLCPRRRHALGLLRKRQETFGHSRTKSRLDLSRSLPRNPTAGSFCPARRKSRVAVTAPVLGGEEATGRIVAATHRPAGSVALAVEVAHPGRCR